MAFLRSRQEFNGSLLREFGLAYAMEVQLTHPVWGTFAAQQSEADAHVRRFLMQHRIEAMYGGGRGCSSHFDGSAPDWETASGAVHSATASVM